MNRMNFNKNMYSNSSGDKDLDNDKDILVEGTTDLLIDISKDSEEYNDVGLMQENSFRKNNL